MKIVFTGGGTAGHIFPGLAVADELKKLSAEKKQPIEMIWIGSKKENEKKLVCDDGLTFISIPTGKLRRYFSLRNVADMFKVIAGIFKSIHLLSKIKPDIVFSKGGYVAVPVCLAAKFLHIPVIIHECDFSPGLTTRITAKFAERICVSYKQTGEIFASKVRRKCVYTGNPVREKFFNADRDAGRKFLGCENTDKKVLLVIGGSLGAAQINDLVAETITLLCENFFVVHQFGSANFPQHTKIKARLSACNEKLLDDYVTFEFIGAEMPNVLAASDIVVSRAGANSLWEIVAQSKPSILIPLSTGSSRGDQIENAAFFKAAGCAEVLQDENATPEKFWNAIHSFLTDDTKIARIKENCKNILPEPAAQKIAQLIYKQGASKCSHH